MIIALLLDETRPASCTFRPPSVVLPVMLVENADRNEQPSRSTSPGA
jgi:hypothetical protein